MGPMMRALTEDFDMTAQNSNAPSYPEQGMSSMPAAGDQHRQPTNNFGPASQTLSGYASQYSTGSGSQNYFGHGHQSSAVNSGFSSPGGNYPPGGMTGPYQRQISASSPLGSPNGHGHSYPRSASAGPTIPSPIMMHGSGMYQHNQTSPGNRSTPFGFPTSPTSPHNHLNHASPPLVSPSGMRPGGNLHSPKSLPASSPVPFVSQMSPTASRAQSVPTLPGNAVDHVPPMSHMRSKSPGSAGIHRPFPQPPPSQPQQLFPLPSPKVRPVDQTDSRGQYVELVHSKPKEQWNSVEKPSREISRNSSEQLKTTSDPGHLPRLEEMVAVLGDSKIKETLNEIVSDKNLSLSENGDDGNSKDTENNMKSTDSDKKTANNNAHLSNEKRTRIDEKNVNSTEKDVKCLANGFVGTSDVVDGKGCSVNGSDGKNSQTVPPSKNVTNLPNVKTNKPNGRTDAEKGNGKDSSNSTNPAKSENYTVKQLNPFQSRPQCSVQTKEMKVEKQEQKPPSVSDSSKCQNENTPSKHSPEKELAANVPSTSTANLTVKSDAQTPPFSNPMTTPTIKRKSPEDSGSSTGNESLPLKKRRGRPPGSKTKNRKEGEEGKPKRKYSKKKKLDLEGEADGNQSKEKSVKSGKTMVKPKQETNTPAVRGPILRVQGSSIESVVSSHVINSPDAEKEEIVKGGKNQQKKKVSKHARRHGGLVTAPVGQAAVIGTECVNPTGLWICALCGNPPNFGALGDLYGPYTPPGSDASSSRRDSSSKSDRHRGSSSRDSSHSSRGSRHLASTSSRGQRVDPRSQSQRGKSLMAKQAETAKSRKWRQVQSYMDEMSLTLGRKSVRRRKSETDDGVLELWVHEECAVWSQGVICLQGTLYGIHQAIKEAECKVRV